MAKINVLINLSTLKKGGGQNVGLNFLYSLLSIDRKRYSFHFFVANGSKIHRYLSDRGDVDFTIAPANPVKRILFEMFVSKYILNKKNIDIIYSYFGLGLFDKKIPQVSGSADSNLFFPEIDFWQEYKGLNRIKKKVVDQYRIYALKRATAVIFENEVLELRAREIYRLKKTKYIKPSINFSSDSTEFSLPNSLSDSVPKGLFLCGWQLNKNVMLIPKIAYELKNKNIPFHFILTAPMDRSSECIEFMRLLDLYSVEDMVSIVGLVQKEELESLYEKVDFVFLLSKLESFSNNIIEAYYYRKLLFVSNELWSRSICGEAAVYVDRDSEKDIANTIVKFLSDKQLWDQSIDVNTRMLSEYPSIDERVCEELEYLEYIYEGN